MISHGKESAREEATHKPAARLKRFGGSATSRATCLMSEPPISASTRRSSDGVKKRPPNWRPSWNRLISTGILPSLPTKQNAGYGVIANLN